MNGVKNPGVSHQRGASKAHEDHQLPLPKPTRSEQKNDKDGIEKKKKKKEHAYDSYDTFEMRVDRHWSRKVFDEMTERDRRIFRAYFSISYKGWRGAI
ncbi:hypothetical protein ABFX02_03G052500 [Erythranthe guttata]